MDSNDPMRHLTPIPLDRSREAAADPRPTGCSCHPGERPEPCQREQAHTHCWLAWSKTRIADLERAIAAAIDDIDHHDESGAYSTLKNALKS